MKKELYINKFILLALALLAFIFLSNDYSTVASDKIAIVVALGIDKAESGYELSAELATSPTEATNGGSVPSEKVISTKGSTISECLSKLFLETGWYPKLNNCALVLISESVAKEDCLDVLEYFIRSERFLDSALISITPSSAKEILLTSTPLDMMSVQAISKITYQKYFAYSNIIATSLKDFAKIYYDEGIDPVTSIVRKLKVDAKQSESNSQKAALGKFSLLDLTNSAVFKKGKLAETLSLYETEAFNFSTKDKIKSEFVVRNVFINGRGKNKILDYSLGIKKVKKEVAIDYKKGVPTLDIKLDLFVDLKDASKTLASVDGLVQISEIPPEILSTANLQLEYTFDSLFEKIVRANADIFGVGKKLRQEDPKKWEEFLISLPDPEKYMEHVNLNAAVFFKSYVKDKEMNL